MGEKTPRRGENGERYANTAPGRKATLVSYRVVTVVAWGSLLRAVTHVALAGSRSGSLLRCLGALAWLFLLRTLATLRVPLCCADLLLRHKILQYFLDHGRH